MLHISSPIDSKTCPQKSFKKPFPSPSPSRNQEHSECPHGGLWGNLWEHSDKTPANFQQPCPKTFFKKKNTVFFATLQCIIVVIFLMCLFIWNYSSDWHSLSKGRATHFKPLCQCLTVVFTAVFSNSSRISLGPGWWSEKLRSWELWLE